MRAYMRGDCGSMDGDEGEFAGERGLGLLALTVGRRCRRLGRSSCCSARHSSTTAEKSSGDMVVALGWGCKLQMVYMKHNNRAARKARLLPPRKEQGGKSQTMRPNVGGFPVACPPSSELRQQEVPGFPHPQLCVHASVEGTEIVHPCLGWRVSSPHRCFPAAGVGLQRPFSASVPAAQGTPFFELRILLGWSVLSHVSLLPPRTWEGVARS